MLDGEAESLNEGLWELPGIEGFEKIDNGGTGTREVAEKCRLGLSDEVVLKGFKIRSGVRALGFLFKHSSWIKGFCQMLNENSDDWRALRLTG